MADEILSCEKMTGDAGGFYCFMFRLDLTPTPVDHCICVYEKEMSDPTGKTDEQRADEAKTLAIPRASEVKARIQEERSSTSVPSVVGPVSL